MRPATFLLCCVPVTLSACTTPTQFTTGGANTSADKGKSYLWSFDAAAGGLPADLFSVLGQWKVEGDGGAPSAPNVLRQSGSYHAGDFPRALVKDLVFADATVAVRCRPEAGSTDQACGLMFRLTDSDNYYVVRANALEGNVNLYHVIGGNREQFAGADTPVASAAWHTLEAAARGTSLSVKWDGAQVITASDATFASGRIGLWTKADSRTAFDDLTAIAE